MIQAPVIEAENLDLTFEGLARDLDVPVIDRHTALGDVVSTALMFIKLQRHSAS